MSEESIVYFSTSFRLIYLLTAFAISQDCLLWFFFVHKKHSEQKHKIMCKIDKNAPQVSGDVIFFSYLSIWIGGKSIILDSSLLHA